MAQRDIVLISHYNSNLLGHIDLTDGTYNGVEHTHSSTIDDLYKVDGKLYADFEDHGGRIATYLGDGKIGPESDDIGIAKPNSTTNYGPVVERMRYPAGIGTFLKIDMDESNNPAQWAVVDAQDNFILGSVNGYLSGCQIAYPEGFELATDVPYSGGAQTIRASGGIAYDRQYWLKGAAFDNSQLIQFINGSDGNVYEVRSNVIGPDEVDNAIYHVEPVSSKMVGAIGANDCVLLSNGKFILSNGGYETVNLWDGTTITQVDAMPYGFLETASIAISRGDTVILYFNVGEIPLTRRGVSSQVVNRISLPELVKTVVTVPPIAEMPAEILLNTQSYSLGIYNGIRVRHIRTFTTPDGVEHFAGALLIENFNTGIYNWYGDFNQRMHTGRPCPLGRLMDDALTSMKLQPYEVTGVVSHSGVKVSTDLILIDNETLAICGRTKSDPVTGIYKFRCYTARKKSVFARHPTKSGLRLAAEVIPVAVD